MKSRGVLLGGIATAALLLAPSGGTSAETPFVGTVTGLRTSTVPLYDCSDGKTKKREFDKANFKAPWPATEQGAPRLFLKVTVEGQAYCVKKFAVETSEPVRVMGKEHCGTLVASREPKTGATRGVGEECGK